MKVVYKINKYIHVDVFFSFSFWKTYQVSTILTRIGISIRTNFQIILIHKKKKIIYLHQADVTCDML